MPIGAHLSHRCTVQRSSAAADPYGGDLPAWMTWLADLPCRLVEDSQRVLDTALAEAPTVSRTRLLVAPGTDVRDGDRITDLVFEDGDRDLVEVNGQMVPSVFSVEAVLHRRGRVEKHITCELKRIS